MPDSSKLFTGTCSHEQGYVTGSVPMSLDDARRFLVATLGRIKLGPDPDGTFERERTEAREIITQAIEPVTLRVGFWSVALEAAEGE
jgi:hypothetical protein